jgi:hypothetical protein
MRGNLEPGGFADFRIGAATVIDAMESKLAAIVRLDAAAYPVKAFYLSEFLHIVALSQ